MKYPILTAVLFAWLALPVETAQAQSNYSPNIDLPPTVAALVRTLLTNPNSRRRAAAAETLGQVGDSRVLEALATAQAHDTEPIVRREAREAIRRIRGNLPGPGPAPGPGPFPPPQQQDPNIALVDSWYQRYLGRSVDRAGIALWAGALRRGASAVDVQSGILGSNEFWEANGRSPNGFAFGLYRSVLGRNANRTEVANWVQRYNVNRGDRARVAGEFLEAAQTELLKRGQNNPIDGW